VHTDMKIWTEIRRKVLVEGASKRSIRRDYRISAEALERILPHPALATFSLTVLVPTPSAPPICRKDSRSVLAASRRSAVMTDGRPPRNGTAVTGRQPSLLTILRRSKTGVSPLLSHRGYVSSWPRGASSGGLYRKRG